ncbi:MAG: hypothetical protein ACYDC3_16610 [Candidatus Binataceae bacterium]
MQFAIENFSTSEMEEDVHKALYRTLNVRRRMRSKTSPSALSKAWIGLRLVSLAQLFEHLTRLVATESFIPDEREVLAACLIELRKLQFSVCEVIALGEEKGMLDLPFGRAIQERLKRASAALLQAESVWQRELNGRFPELFDELDKIIDSIEPGVLPIMAPETLLLAKQAIGPTARLNDREIDLWAARLAEDVLSEND